MTTAEIDRLLAPKGPRTAKLKLSETPQISPASSSTRSAASGAAGRSGPVRSGQPIGRSKKKKSRGSQALIQSKAKPGSRGRKQRVPKQLAAKIVSRPLKDPCVKFAVGVEHAWKANDYLASLEPLRWKLVFLRVIDFLICRPEMETCCSTCETRLQLLRRIKVACSSDIGAGFHAAVMLRDAGSELVVWCSVRVLMPHIGFAGSGEGAETRLKCRCDWDSSNSSTFDGGSNRRYRTYWQIVSDGLLKPIGMPKSLTGRWEKIGSSTLDALQSAMTTAERICLAAR